jgi:serine/threonine-protein kinase HipA
MADIEVHIDLEGRTRPVGLARSNKVRGNETVVFDQNGSPIRIVSRSSLPSR